MNPPTVGTNVHRRCSRHVSLHVSLLFGALLAFTACGGSESSGESVSTPPEAAAGAAASEPAEVPSNAPLGTGFVMVSAVSQLQITEGTFVEESDCTARVSALGNAEDYASCLEVPPAAICLQVAEGSRASDQWWDCFVEEPGCEEALAAHEVVREVEGYVREILRTCSETEMATVFASM